jgi:LuxR family transcriptional regulator, maltose regulon positive regulatory protein
MLAALEARTEGWIAGLQLAALAMRDRGELASFIEAFSGSHRFVADYLVEEVFLRQSAAVQEFLLRTSVLDRMCASLCQALADDGSDARSAQRQLEELERPRWPPAGVTGGALRHWEPRTGWRSWLAEHANLVGH